MSTVSLTGLLQIDLPEVTLRYCDGGFFQFGGEAFRSKDPVFGTIGAVQPLREGAGDLVPALAMKLLPPDTSTAAELSKPGHQTARVRFWIAEYDVATGIISTADVQFDGQIDQSILTVAKGTKELAVSVVSLAERLFEGNIGNSLNATWHKSVWPGEKGHDNATGLGQPIAWGVEAPRGGGSGGSFWSDPWSWQRSNR
ncbi:hypothetical protein NCF86_00185 [Pelagerythrobacter marinus]|nr:hypothetical protein NCF86_00185 [Pelagerythrobacter marinus]